MLAAELQQTLGLEVSIQDLPDLQNYGYVDDCYASLEWSAGRFILTHIAFWIVGSPRIDKVVVPTGRTSPKWIHECRIFHPSAGNSG